MPVVQRYGERKVQTDALPGVRKTAAETALSEGAGLAEAQAGTAETIGQVGGTAARIGLSQYQDIVKEERQKADEVALLAADVKLAQWENKRLYDPNTGALTVKGEAAQPLPEQINAEFSEVSGDIEKNLSTDTQREKFARMRTQRQINVDATIRRHVFGEMQTWRGQELQGLIENAHSTAVANAMDPRRVGEELQRGIDAIKTNAPRLGLGPQQIEEQLTKFESATHVGVIDRLLAGNQTKAAKIYYDEAKGQITGDAMVRVEKALEAGTQRAEAQKQTDSILAGGGTLSEQRDKAKAIDDPEIRDQVQQRLEHEAAVKDRNDREVEEGRLTNAYNIVDKTHDVTGIPVDVWSQLPGGARSSLRAYADRLARGVGTETDLPTYYAMMQQAGDDPTTFAKQNLLNYRGKLDDGDFKHLTQLQMSLRAGDRKKADENLSGFRTHKELVDDTLSQYGIASDAKPGSSQDLAIAQLRRMLDRQVETVQQTTGKKVSNDDVQSMLDGILSKKETVPGSWWSLWPSNFFAHDKKLLDYTAADIPATDRAQIENALRRKGQAVSDATVLDLFLSAKLRKK